MSAPARKAMEEAIEEDDSDIDDEDLFNLNDDDGECSPLLSFSRSHYTLDDVFDDETAYLEMLAKEVSHILLASNRALIHIAHRMSACRTLA
jgi:hypothetical protein